jgi:hypothetical protein
MKWAYSVRRKISAALLLAAIFVLLFVKSMMNNNNVAKLGTSFSSVYEDRLLVEAYIYRMSEHLFRKKIMIDSASTRQYVLQVKPAIDRYNETIRGLIASYGATKLTQTEAIYFNDFKKNVGELIEAERIFFERVQAGDERNHAKPAIDHQFNLASTNLDLLSGIQISEGKLLNDKSKKIVAGSSLLTQFEIGILIAVGLMVLVLVFESTTVWAKGVAGDRMN